MVKSKAATHFVAVSDLSKPVAAQEGILLEVEGRGGDTPKNRQKALDQINDMWEKGEIAADKFPDGISLEHIFFVPPHSLQLQSPEDLNQDQTLLPVIQGAREIIELTKLQIEVQEAAAETAPYTPIIEAVLERTRPLTPEEKDLAKEKKYGKTIERLGMAIASQEEYQENCTGNGKLILNAIAWQMAKTNDPDD
ncbi:MAG: hypothetical protein SAJ12_19405 [Jaaginema sp. PMC 1079.18]|nr:hypothetical protein [Jaaginema sp. PMC 1080.18]MEC4853155.1 hypothetical protein [Jaaginema sp. PMC 1079.18]MEC4867744.1 hypothetical protein [Jaaginema sp. PMC 1078.18]